ncbi:macrophage mannose receptor 1-like [Silurus meridionalis]|uniref:macrophage mannose receptor 1-like n=1 Tax=Silurus meridionalis TaxID=175797 RepID=UPI001EEABA94|nr:macrophage mannose receptor 1-like [Silurus meridionalis]
MNPTVHFLLFLSGVGFSLSLQYFYVSQSMTWSDAQTYCRAKYIDLVTVHSMDEVNSTIALAASAAPGYTGSVWLGLHRTWTWATGEPYSGQVPFMSGQPNEGNDRAACAVITINGLEDWFCSTSHYFICYNDSPTATSKFVLIPRPMNWTDASAYCRKNYAELVTVKTSTDQNNAISLLGGNAFVGLISAQWSDYSFSTFRYWTGVSSLEASLSNKCAAMVISDSGKWNSFDCALPKPFICYGASSLGPAPGLYHAVNVPKNWSDAQRYCRERFTDLATVDSVNNVYSVMNQVDLSYNGLLWIGLQKPINKLWWWSLGDEPLSDYFNWATGKPSGIGQCVSNMNAFWSDTDCQTPLYFVCYSAGTGYIMVNITKTWQDAQSYCRSTYTDLARIRSPWEQNQVNNVVSRWVSVWIGLFLDNWQWSDQWSHRFRNWALGPPSVGTGDCAAVVAGNSGKWMSDSCTTLHPFVCYGDVDKMIKRQIIRVKLSSNGMTNLDDLSVQAAMYEIEQKLKANGMNQNVKLSWRVGTDGRVFKKVLNFNGVESGKKCRASVSR